MLKIWENSEEIMGKSWENWGKDFYKIFYKFEKKFVKT